MKTLKQLLFPKRLRELEAQERNNELHMKRILETSDEVIEKCREQIIRATKILEVCQN